jgi:pimeloyl-ACP methyl ester carboxylesterase
VVLTTERGAFAAHEANPPPGVVTRGTAVLVPGFTGSKEDFITVLEPLAVAGYRVLAIDQRGQFETSGPEDAGAYHLDALGADLIAIVTDSGGRAHLVGHSFGGLAVRAATIAAPQAVCSATLLCSGPGPLSGPQVDRLETLVGALAVFSIADIWTIIEVSAATSGDNDGVAPDVREFLRRRFLSSTKAGLDAMARQLLDTPDRVSELAATGVPLLVAYGVDDDVWLPDAQAEMARRLGAREQVINGAGHSPAVQRPTETAAALIEFWSGTRQD